MPFIQLGSSIRYDLNEVLAYLKTNRRLSSHVDLQKRRAALEAAHLTTDPKSKTGRG